MWMPAQVRQHLELGLLLLPGGEGRKAHRHQENPTPETLAHWFALLYHPLHPPCGSFSAERNHVPIMPSVNATRQGDPVPSEPLFRIANWPAASPPLSP